MHLIKPIFALGLTGFVAGFAAAIPPASAADGANQCFFSSQFESWRAPDAKTIFIRVNHHNYYRLDLANACSALLWPDAHLITKVHGPDTICSPLDWDLKVGQGFPSIPEPCIVKTMTKLSPAEAESIPKKFKP